MSHRFASRLGFHPWEDAWRQPPFVEKVTELLAQEESGREPPFGRALDVGTGSGIWAVELARRGWQVTALDKSSSALRRVRERAQNAGVDLRLVHGDVTTLHAAGTGSRFQLVLDTGTFHGLNPAERAAMGREISRVTTPQATVLLLVWAKRTRPLIRGASAIELAIAFPKWTVACVGPSNLQAPRPIELLLKPDEHWYRLDRADNSPLSD
jgi:ubiquinone/menaquinone biosynthesis C-methylase UbiE